MKEARKDGRKEGKKVVGTLVYSCAVMVVIGRKVKEAGKVKEGRGGKEGR